MDILQLKITLHGSKPPIWRRVLVDKATTFHKLHLIIQTVMGWEDDHLYSFEFGPETIGRVDPEYGIGEESTDAKKVKLSGRVSQPKDKFNYEYDFGDSWEHKIIVEKVLPRDENTQYPICIDGALNCPPEDCGGIWGFYYLLEILKDKNHPKHVERMEWIGEDYDPEYFDKEAVNKVLRKRK